MTKSIITIKNPWAYLICSGVKDIENRTWKTKYRGLLYIHSSKIPVKGNVAPAPSGAIIGSVELVDCIRNSNSPWAMYNHWHWVIKNPILFDNPILNVSGKIGLWQISEAVSVPIS